MPIDEADLMTIDPRRDGRLVQVLSPVVSRLHTLSPLSQDDISTLERLMTKLTLHAAGHRIVEEGKRGPLAFLTSGWACRQRHLKDGRYQIVSLVLPGDALYPLTRPNLAAPCGAVALTEVTMVDAAALVPLVNSGAEGSTLSDALRMSERHDEHLLRDQIVRLGAQSAYERMVHLFLECFIRLRSAGLTNGNAFAMPLSQELLSHVLGLSVVHTNRTLQQIRRDKLLHLHSRTMVILDEPRMHAIADWSPLVTAGS